MDLDLEEGEIMEGSAARSRHNSRSRNRERDSNDSYRHSNTRSKHQGYERRYDRGYERKRDRERERRTSGTRYANSGNGTSFHSSRSHNIQRRPHSSTSRSSYQYESFHSSQIRQHERARSPPRARNPNRLTVSTHDASNIRQRARSSSHHLEIRPDPRHVNGSYWAAGPNAPHIRPAVENIPADVNRLNNNIEHEDVDSDSEIDSDDSSSSSSIIALPIPNKPAPEVIVLESSESEEDAKPDEVPEDEDAIVELELRKNVLEQLLEKQKGPPASGTNDANYENMCMSMSSEDEENQGIIPPPPPDPIRRPDNVPSFTNSDTSHNSTQNGSALNPTFRSTFFPNIPTIDVSHMFVRRENLDKLSNQQVLNPCFATSQEKFPSYYCPEPTTFQTDFALKPKIAYQPQARPPQPLTTLPLQNMEGVLFTRRPNNLATTFTYSAIPPPEPFQNQVHFPSTLTSIQTPNLPFRQDRLESNAQSIREVEDRLQYSEAAARAPDCANVDMDMRFGGPPKEPLGFSLDVDMRERVFQPIPDTFARLPPAVPSETVPATTINPPAPVPAVDNPEMFNESQPSLPLPPESTIPPTNTIISVAKSHNSDLSTASSMSSSQCEVSASPDDDADEEELRAKLLIEISKKRLASGSSETRTETKVQPQPLSAPVVFPSTSSQPSPESNAVKPTSMGEESSKLQTVEKTQMVGQPIQNLVQPTPNPVRVAQKISAKSTVPVNRKSSKDNPAQRARNMSTNNAASKARKSATPNTVRIQVAPKPSPTNTTQSSASYAQPMSSPYLASPEAVYRTPKSTPTTQTNAQQKSNFQRTTWKHTQSLPLPAMTAPPKTSNPVPQIVRYVDNDMFHYPPPEYGLPFHRVIYNQNSVPRSPVPTIQRTVINHAALVNQQRFAHLNSPGAQGIYRKPISPIIIHIGSHSSSDEDYEERRSEVPRPSPTDAVQTQKRQSVKSRLGPPPNKSVLGKETSTSEIPIPPEVSLSIRQFAKNACERVIQKKLDAEQEEAERRKKADEEETKRKEAESQRKAEEEKTQLTVAERKPVLLLAKKKRVANLAAKKGLQSTAAPRRIPIKRKMVANSKKATDQTADKKKKLLEVPSSINETTSKEASEKALTTETSEMPVDEQRQSEESDIQQKKPDGGAEVEESGQASGTKEETENTTTNEATASSSVSSEKPLPQPTVIVYPRRTISERPQRTLPIETRHEPSDEPHVSAIEKRAVSPDPTVRSASTPPSNGRRPFGSSRRIMVPKAMKNFPRNMQLEYALLKTKLLNHEILKEAKVGVETIRGVSSEGSPTRVGKINNEASPLKSLTSALSQSSKPESEPGSARTRSVQSSASADHDSGFFSGSSMLDTSPIIRRGQSTSRQKSKAAVTIKGAKSTLKKLKLPCSTKSEAEINLAVQMIRSSATPPPSSIIHSDIRPLSPINELKPADEKMDLMFSAENDFVGSTFNSAGETVDEENSVPAQPIREFVLRERLLKAKLVRNIENSNHQINLKTSETTLVAARTEALSHLDSWLDKRAQLIRKQDQRDKLGKQLIRLKNETMRHERLIMGVDRHVDRLREELGSEVGAALDLAKKCDDLVETCVDYGRKRNDANYVPPARHAEELNRKFKVFKAHHEALVRNVQPLACLELGVTKSYDQADSSSDEEELFIGTRQFADVLRVPESSNTIIRNYDSPLLSIVECPQGSGELPAKLNPKLALCNEELICSACQLKSCCFQHLKDVQIN